MRLRCILTFLYILLLSTALQAQTQYLLTTASPSAAQDVCGRHGLSFVDTAWYDYTAGKGVYLVSSPIGISPNDVKTALSTDTAVMALEPVQPVSLPELAGANSFNLSQSTSPLLETLNPNFLSFFGNTVHRAYVRQKTTQLIHSGAARKASGLSGAGIVVAVIDTGIDPNHPVFAGVLVPGFDFTRGIAGSASELADLDPATSAVVSQSTSPLLEGVSSAELSQSTSPLLESAIIVPMNGFTSAVLAQSTSPLLEGIVPQAFGHGTMTAGLVHLVAPNAKIMALKAFGADGSSNTFNIVRAIYYAVQNGANIVSMSFEITQASPALQAAIDYADRHGVVLVAAAGNDSWQTSVFPAAFNHVLGVGSTNFSDVRSTFSNFGSADVMFAAPGEGVITTYPGGFYAAGWGTSFSAPLVSGSSALILERNFKNGICGLSSVINPLSKAIQVPQMGYGRIDLIQAVTSLNTSGTTSTSTSTTNCRYVNGVAIVGTDEANTDINQ